MALVNRLELACTNFDEGGDAKSHLSLQDVEDVDRRGGGGGGDRQSPGTAKRAVLQCGVNVEASEYSKLEGLLKRLGDLHAKIKTAACKIRRLGDTYSAFNSSHYFLLLSPCTHLLSWT